MGSRWAPAVLLASALAAPQRSPESYIQTLIDGGDYRQAEASARAALADSEKQAESLQTARLLDLLAKSQIALALNLTDAAQEVSRASPCPCLAGKKR